MTFLYRFLSGAKNLLSRRRRSEDLDEELEGFLHAAAADKMRRGHTSTDALREARVEMGSREAVKEEVRAVGWETTVEALWLDLRFSVRMLLKSPGFTAVAVISLALGIGANTAIFTLIDGVMLRTLPVRDPAALVSFGKEVGGGEVDGIGPGPLDLFPYEFYRRLEVSNSLLAGVCAYSSFNPVVSFRALDRSAQPAKQAVSHLVSGNFFQVLGATPILGRALEPADDQLHQPVIVTSFRFWKENLQGDPDAVGRAVRINNTRFTIAGVMPDSFTGVSPADEAPDLWVPLAMQQEIMLQPSLLGPRGLFWLHLMGRLKSGIASAQVQAWVTSRLQQYFIDREGPNLNTSRRREIRGIFVEVLPGNRGISELRDRYSQPLILLMGVVVSVLLIACANLANFLLARAASRELEIATRLALGSGQFRVLRQLLLEALLLAVSGGALGLGLAYVATRGLIAFIASGSTHLGLSPNPDARVLFFTLLMSVVTGILFGLAPLLRVGRLSAAPALQANVRSAVSAGGRSARLLARSLIAAQVMLSLTLLVTAGLFVRTLRNLETRDFGFSRSGVLLVLFNAKLAGYRPEQLNSFYSRLINGVTALPGVISASVSGTPPIHSGNWDSPIFFKGNVPGRNDTSTWLNRVGPNYFQTVGIPLLRGRTIAAQDSASSVKIVVVNQALANYFFPNGDAIGHTFTVADPAVSGEFQIVGVVRNAKYSSPREQQHRMAYLPVLQLTGDVSYAYWLEVKTAGDAETAAAGIRRGLAKIDPALPLLAVNTMAQKTDLQMTNEILISRLSTFFAVLAISLACVGLYGVMSYDVVRRSSEIGIRLTVGAGAATILWMVLRESLALLAIAIAVGLPATLGIARLFQSQLFGLQSWDPLTLGGSVVVLLLVVLLGAYFPARRAATVDPAVTLRHQ